MSIINPYIGFNGKCREAMTFYKECLDGDLSLQKIGESPMAAQMSSEMGPQILHSILTRGNTLLLMGSDCMGQEVYPGNTVKLCLNCSSNEEIHTIFTNLSGGGKVTMPLHQSFWGATFGELTDKYGMHWMLNYSKS